MSLVERVKQLCEANGTTFAALERELGFSESSIRKWVTSSPATDKLQKVADYFHVTTDYLLGRENAALGELSSRDQRDIAKTMEALREQLLHEDGLMFDGEPLSPEAMESILSAMKLGLEAAKQRNKEKYTPKKHKAPQE